MRKPLTPQQLSQELVDLTSGSEVQSAHERDVSTILSAPLHSVLYPRMTMEQALTFVVRCMAAGKKEYLDQCEEISLQRNTRPAQPAHNRIDYGEQ